MLLSGKLQYFPLLIKGGVFSGIGDKFCKNHCLPYSNQVYCEGDLVQRINRVDMARKPLTHRQHQFLDWIWDCILEHGKSPTMKELGDQFEMKAPSAFDVVNALVKKGYLRKRGRNPFVTLELVDEFGQHVDPSSLPVIGDVAAGVPLLAVDNRIGMLTVDDRLMQRGASFALRVKGDSMIEEGIYNGDYVIIKKQSAADDGDIVLAVIGEEATIKRFYRYEGGLVRLHPANSVMQDILIQADNCLIQGVVIGVQREL